MYTGSSCPISSATLGFPVFKSCIILVGMCSGISLWFKVHFHDVWSRAPLHILTSHVAILFPKVSLQAVCPFGYWVVVSLLICKRISKFKTGGAGCKESQKEMLQGQPGMLKKSLTLGSHRHVFISSQTGDHLTLLSISLSWASVSTSSKWASYLECWFLNGTMKTECLAERHITGS